MKSFFSFLSQCLSILVTICRFLFGMRKPVVRGAPEVLPSDGPGTFEEQPEEPDHGLAGPSAISDEELPRPFIGYWTGPELPPP